MLQRKMDAYAKFVAETSKHVPGDLVGPVLELVAEAGEAAGEVVKVYRERGGAFLDEMEEFGRSSKLMYELSDVLWGLQALCSGAGVTLPQLMDINYRKLRERRGEPFTDLLTDFDLDD